MLLTAVPECLTEAGLMSILAAFLTDTPEDEHVEFDD